MLKQQQQKLAGMEVKKKRTSSFQKEEKVAGVDGQLLDLSGMSLETLPVVIDPSLNMTLVTTLDLSSNFLQSIPESLTARLLNVVVLDVHSNELKSLPNSIGCLSKLKVLNVSGNHLQSLPRTIENCRSLEELNANFNMLTRLPDTIGFELINLKKLMVNSNKLVFLPSSTSHLTNLRILDARLNCLRSLPDDLENLINLEILNVSQNFQYLTTIPYSVGLLLSLVELDVSYNKITTLPNSIGCLGKLQKLCVEGNPLVSPPTEVVEQGLEKVQVYLTQMINGQHKNSVRKSWGAKFKRYSTFSRANVHGNINYQKQEGYIIPSYNRIEFMGMFSPMRLFSPKSYFTR
ncbi:hypothetical protein DCAR_0520622 [Daucus carota subsp. sativus]|uniref:Uncharacterized protein n=1 Tax=Daucus carota subsp. sativus TaxID=79200 RepID=A0AAF0X4X4_DAUCS|nr:hypothetical protein DCAR_0520622 [Daucus carota subsp. sativus]